MSSFQEKSYCIFDLEVYPKWWCIVFKPKGKEHIIITSDNYTLTKIFSICCDSILTGFNNKNYDMKILDAILKGYDVDRIYTLSDNIIKDNPDVLDNINFWNKYTFTDLMDDWKKGSLKEYESNKGISIKETDIPFGKEDLTDKEKESIIKYCCHDVDATELLLEDRLSYLEAKLQLAKMFNINKFKALKSTNAKLCALILKASPIEREKDLKYIIPKKIESYLYENLPSEVISMFSELNDNEKLANLFENNVVFGIGGIHSVYSDNIETHSDENYALVNVDVTSYYPNLMIHFKYMSRNVPDPDLYEKIYELRKTIKTKAKEELKTNGKTSAYWELEYAQLGLKLILNTTYGATKNKYNALYDEYQASSLCYTGQLLLAALASKLYSKIPELKVIQTNTDGILVKINRKYLEDLKKYVSEWETMCGFTMEFDYIKEFFQRDVNNYIECTGNPKDPYKLKGKWANQAFSEEITSNLNAPIIHTALLKYYTEKTNIEDTINNCNNILDFCYTTKTGRTYDGTFYEINDEFVPTNKVNRVVATTDKTKGTIYKYKRVDEPLSEPNPFMLKDEDYKKLVREYKNYLKRKEKFEAKYKMPFGRMDKIAEIPLNCELINDDPKMIDTLDKQWYVDYCKTKIKELINV